MSEIPLKGDRVRLVRMSKDPDPVPVGTRGTVTRVATSMNIPYQISVRWDNGRSLSLIPDEDEWEVIK